MRKFRLALVAVLALPVALPLAAAAEPGVQLHVLSPGVSTAGIRVLGVRFTKTSGTAWENGPDIDVTNGTVGAIQKAITSGKPADIVLLPPEEMDALEKSGALMKGSNIRLGRVDFGVAIPAGSPRPDISTYAKFRDTLLAANSVAHTDPKLGSAGGTLIANFLTRPEFQGIKKIVLSGNGAVSVSRGDADIAIETMGTLLATYGVESAGLVPASLNAHLQISIGVLADAASPEEALAFERYVTRPGASPAWKAWGVVR